MDVDLKQVLEILKAGKNLDEKCVTLLLKKYYEVLFSLPNLLKIQAPVVVCGDIHGQLFDLFSLIEISGDPSTTQFLFLGDYVDRGYFSLSVFLYLLTLQLLYPENVHLLRGNHECRVVSQTYGFYEECLFLYGHAGIWNFAVELFDLLPVSALVNDKIFCTHGGLSPFVSSIDQIALINRFVELPMSGPHCDLLWSDPEEIEEWGVTQRGAGWLFGSKPTKEFCHNNKIDLIARAHQLVMEGYQYFFSERVLTVWSAPNYGYRSGNIASVLVLDSHLNRELRVFNENKALNSTKLSDVVAHYFT